GMTAIIQARLPHQTAHELIVTGTRYTAETALQQKIVDHAVPESEVLSKAIDIAAALASKANPAMHLLKAGMYPRALEALALQMDAIPAEARPNRARWVSPGRPTTAR
ncbi:MAG: enoyl-CoA hydratase-related protein, partial [Myxococcota bacterium]